MREAIKKAERKGRRRFGTATKYGKVAITGKDADLKIGGPRYLLLESLDKEWRPAACQARQYLPHATRPLNLDRRSAPAS